MPLSSKGDRTSRLVVVFPQSYPHTRFAIYAPDLQLARHQNPFEKNLCILPRHSDNWQPQFLAADFVHEDVPKLIRLVEKGGDELFEQEDPQGEPISTYFSYFPLGGVVVPEQALHIPASVDRGKLELRFQRGLDWIQQIANGPNASEGVGQALLQAVFDSTGNELASPEEELGEAFSGPKWRGRWMRLTEAPLASDANSLARHIAAKHPNLLKWQKENRVDALAFDVLGVVFPEEVSQGAYEDTWVFLIVGGKKNTKSYPDHGHLLRALRFSREHLFERVPELKGLEHKTLSIVGLGSLGSRLIHEACRSQVGGLHVMDFDFVEAGSIVRWDWGLTSSGANKTDFIVAEVRKNYPFTKVESFNLAVGDASIGKELPDEGQLLDEWASGANLLIDATAESNVSRLISDLGWEERIPQMYLWSVDGYGGVVARLRPGKTGCFHCLELAFAEGGHIPPPRSSNGSVTIQPRGCADQTFTAPGVDLNPICDQAVRVALSTLLEGSGGYPEILGDVWVVQVRNADGSLLPFPEWRVYNLPHNPQCPLCR